MAGQAPVPSPSTDGRQGSLFFADMDRHFVVKLVSGLVCMFAGIEFLLCVLAQANLYWPSGGHAYRGELDRLITFGVVTILSYLIFRKAERARRRRGRGSTIPFWIGIALLPLVTACPDGSGGRTLTTLRFSSATYTVDEVGGSQTITVLREGRGRGAVTVEYATGNGTATAGADYVSSFGELSWSKGDRTPKSFSVTITDDALVEGQETVNLTLNTTKNRVVLAAPSAAVLTIVDDECGGGALDPGFGTAGIVTNDPTPGWDTVRDVAASGAHIFVVGVEEDTPGTWELLWRVEKRALGDGSLDPSFGAGGVLRVDPSPDRDETHAVALDATSLYIVGRDTVPGGIDRRWRIEKRDLVTGTLDPAFGSSGVVISDPSTGEDRAVGVAIDGNSLYVIGSDEIYGRWDWQWRIEKRRIVDGALVPAFGAGGVEVNNPSSDEDSPRDIAIDGSFMYIAGVEREAVTSESLWRIEKRDLGDGSLDAAFGSGGVVQSDPTPDSDEPLAVVVDSTSLYVGGYDSIPGPADWQWRIEKRSLVDGSLEAGFGSGGILTHNPGPGHWENVVSMEVDGTTLYVVGRGEVSAIWDWNVIVEKRSLLDGALDGTFGTAGVLTIDPTSGRDGMVGIITGPYLILAGEDTGPQDYRWRIEKRCK